MKAQAGKTQENKSQTTGFAGSQKHDSEAAFQFFDNSPEAAAQRKLKEIANNSVQAIQLRTIQEMADNHSSRQQKENTTGLPDELKEGIENLSDYSLDNVKVHYNSNQPAELQAHAYTQGTNIYLSPGREKDLPHEAWHVVQQMQGRVKPTMQVKNGVSVNDDTRLEREADVMGARAPRMKREQKARPVSVAADNTVGHFVAQLRGLKNVGKNMLTNFGAAMKIEAFKNGIANFYEGYGGATRVDYMAGQLFSVEGEDFESLEQFMIELEYDLATKSAKWGSTEQNNKKKFLVLQDEDLTLQELYMTEYGWKRAAKKARPDIRGQKLKLYRTMDVADWKKLDANDYSVLQGGHVGDFKQALKYFLGESKDPKVMVEFTLKAGSERALFSSALALPKVSERSDKLKVMATAMGNKQFSVATKNEGTATDAIGVKSESEGEAGFSIGIGGGSTAAKFMALVESIALKPIGDKYSKEPTKITGKKVDKEAETAERVKADAHLLLGVNNCLINAIAMAALDRTATEEELIAIRGEMNNYGEMLLATPQVVSLIQTTLHIAEPVTVIYQGATPSEDFDGQGTPLLIYHVGGNHFTHEGPEDEKKDEKKEEKK